MQEVWNTVRISAESLPEIASFGRYYLPFGMLTIALFLSVYVVPASDAAVAEFGDANARIVIAIGRTLTLSLGASFPLIVGQLGMRMAIQANVRAASAARRGFNEALSIAYYAGTITGCVTDVWVFWVGRWIFIIFGKAAPDVLLGFGFGGTVLGLVHAVRRQIYTKAANVAGPGRQSQEGYS